jgi:hypothetical protein
VYPHNGGIYAPINGVWQWNGSGLSQLRADAPGW